MTGHARTKRTIQRAREDFLAALCDGATVTGAAMRASLPRQTVYDWRNADEQFRRQWDDSLDSGSDRLEDEAFRRAYSGVAEPLTSGGKPVRNEDGSLFTVQKYSDTLMCLLLKARKPEKFRERTETKHTGDPSSPVQMVSCAMTPKEAADAYARTLDVDKG